MNFAVSGLKGLVRMIAQAAAARLSPIKALQTGRLGLAPAFLGQHTNPAANARRKAKKAAGGFRQFKKQRRAERIASQIVSEVIAAFPPGNP